MHFGFEWKNFRKPTEGVLKLKHAQPFTLTVLLVLLNYSTATKTQCSKSASTTTKAGLSQKTTAAIPLLQHTENDT
jgi:hypothetical protein